MTDLSSVAKHLALARRRATATARPRPLEIGLVNNMPDAALRATERQFRSLIGAAAGDETVRLTVYSLPDVPRAHAGQTVVRAYRDISELWNTRLDGLIVTGTEPRADDLRQEPYWAGMTRVMEWAERETVSTIWSCLAAHALVLHLDGIERQRSADKQFGVFVCRNVGAHPLTPNGGVGLRIPHSRWNDLAESDLAAAGYRVLTRSDRVGVDAFVKQRKSLFVCFQGHPEYEADTLLLEFRRDVGRFLRGERDTFPLAPDNYFDPDALHALNALRERATAGRQPELIARFPRLAVANSWRQAAVGIYRNWLRYLREQQHASGHRPFSDSPSVRSPLDRGRSPGASSPAPRGPLRARP